MEIKKNMKQEKKNNCSKKSIAKENVRKIEKQISQREALSIGVVSKSSKNRFSKSCEEKDKHGTVYKLITEDIEVLAAESSGCEDW